MVGPAVPTMLASRPTSTTPLISTPDTETEGENTERNRQAGRGVRRRAHRRSCSRLLCSSCCAANALTEDGENLSLGQVDVGVVLGTGRAACGQQTGVAHCARRRRVSDNGYLRRSRWRSGRLSSLAADGRVVQRSPLQLLCRSCFTAHGVSVCSLRGQARKRRRLLLSDRLHLRPDNGDGSQLRLAHVFGVRRRREGE